jgi:hypothetical protein
MGRRMKDEGEIMKSKRTQQSTKGSQPARWLFLIARFPLVAAASRTATSRGGPLRYWGCTSLGNKTKAAGDHTTHGNSGLRMQGERNILHALLELEGLGLIALPGRDGLVEISSHGGKVVRDTGFEYVVFTEKN